MTTLGKYQIHEELGRGAYAVVYRATHSTLYTQVALKELHRGLIDVERARKRFLQEAQVISALDHPNIVRILDMDEDQGRVFFTMPYFPDGDLTRWSQAHGPLSWAQQVDILRQVAAALDYAHARRIYHRDVKPSNILFRIRAGQWEAVLSDFGLVRVQDAAERPTTQLNAVIGSPLYMSPEQIQNRELDGGADQYSLGVVAYEMIAGRVPFQSEIVSDLWLMHVNEPVPPASGVTPGVYPELDPVLSRALAKASPERYPTCTEFVNALQAAFQAGDRRVSLELLEKARGALRERQLEQAGALLEQAAQILPDAPGLEEARAELEAVRRQFSQVEAIRQYWQQARQQAQAAFELFPDQPDPHNLFVTFDLLPPPPLSTRERLVQAGIGILSGAALAVLILGFIYNIIAG